MKKIICYCILTSFLFCNPKNKQISIHGSSGIRECDSCLVESKCLPKPLGIENEKNFCYLICLMQALAPMRLLYNQFKKCKDDDPVACQCYYIIKKIREGKQVQKPDIRQLVNALCKTGWLNEHDKPRFREEPRDPSYLLKFFLDRISKKYLRLMSIINSNNNKVNYCVDEGENYDNIDISCKVNDFAIKNTNILILISIYEGKDSTKSISYKTLKLKVPKEHSRTPEDLNYCAVSFIHVTPNSNGTNHATAYVYRKNNKTGIKEWYHCNDDQVEKCKNQEMEALIKSENTLIILYERDCK